MNPPKETIHCADCNKRHEVVGNVVYCPKNRKLKEEEGLT
jgi:hypothetical protein